MKIGEFAEACNLPLSVLRYYDNCELLKPVYVDRFTGYRHYSESQIEVCSRIGELKSADFSLAEIKRLISGNLTEDEMQTMFDQKKEQLIETLRILDMLREKLSGGIFMAVDYYETMHENVQFPFENDERIIGRWEIFGEYSNRTEFELDNKLTQSDIGNKKREIYFLPNGEWYWCYSWTKGKLLIDDGESSCVNEYSLEKKADGLYMFVNLKSYDYLRSGRTTLLVLRQLDRKYYRACELARKDHIDMPFMDDANVIGKWQAVNCVRSKEDFLPEKIKADLEFYFKEIEFLPNGECISVYGEEIIKDRIMQEWTNGYVLRKWNNTACAYEIRTISGTEYLFLEWKSGDYRWGGFETDYYVFERKI
ncbi:MAG: MerR family transcriptional regulator [Clostridia bacterium]|nr:MerR family transcriptional regulator [Clostridia bacterium]